MTWADDGRILVVSSSDGFCSIIAFDKGELGREFVQNPRKLEDISNKIDVSKPIIEIPADKIISVDQKFASPEKKDKPVTPIAIRRHPRTSGDTPTTDDSGKNSPGTTATTPKSCKLTPQPIAIRRQPRVIVSETAESSKITEEAVDAWPLDSPKPPPLLVANETFMSPVESDKTQDIELRVVDDDDEDSPQKLSPEPMEVDTKPGESKTPTPKTPRRVEFRTISTPKSKKKLLE